jgi:hypothetical protein
MPCFIEQKGGDLLCNIFLFCGLMDRTMSCVACTKNDGVSRLRNCAGRATALARYRRKAINRVQGSGSPANRTIVLSPEETPMKLVLTLLGVILLIIAAVYFFVPADQLPGFFPGHEEGVTRAHMKHGIVSGVAGIVLLAAGTWMGRR